MEARSEGAPGINALILWGAVVERGFAGQSWLIFRQALGLGCNVRKGEKGARPTWRLPTHVSHPRQ